jgi:uridine kinase
VRRQQVLNRLADGIGLLSSPHPVRVAVDGIDAAGKTTLADELAALLEERGRPVIRASVDGFHRPRSERYQRGAESPEGYYLDAFDYPALCGALLLPLGPLGSRRYVRAVFDVHADCSLSLPEEEAPANAILVLDGVFLLRPELMALWDYRIWVEVPFDVALARARQRDVGLFGSAVAVEERYRSRYIPGQRLYLDTVHPRERADVIVDNTNPAQPVLSFRSACPPG